MQKTILFISILILLGSCKTSKTHCDAYGELKQQHDAYHSEPVKPQQTK